MKTFKTFLLVLNLIFCQFAFAQDELKARIEFEEAEKYYTTKDFPGALTHLEKAETLLGQWTPTVSYLKIQALNEITSSETLENENKQKLVKEVKLYMDYANRQKENVVLDKFKVVYAIEEELKPLIKNDNELKAADFLDAQKAEQEKNYEKAMTGYIKASEKGNTNAVYSIGNLYENGLGVPKDEVKALGFFQKAANEGNILAFIKIGDFYSNGTGGVIADNIKAREWYQKAIQNGDVSALYKMGVSYGKSPESLTEQRKWFNKAAEKGNVDALFSIGESYYNSSSYKILALDWYEKAADKGHKKAIERVLELYSSSGSPNYKPKADRFAFYLKQANAGNMTAAHLLGMCYYDGEGVEKNYAKAHEWLLKSASATGEGAFYLGLMYQYGGAVEVDYAKAAEWYIKYDSQLSLKSAAELYRKGGYNLQKDSNKASELMKLSRNKK